MPEGFREDRQKGGQSEETGAKLPHKALRWIDHEDRMLKPITKACLFRRANV
jgi:hypothetical protein